MKFFEKTPGRGLPANRARTVFFLCIGLSPPLAGAILGIELSFQPLMALFFSRTRSDAIMFLVSLVDTPFFALFSYLHGIIPAIIFGCCMATYAYFRGPPTALFAVVVVGAVTAAASLIVHYITVREVLEYGGFANAVYPAMYGSIGSLYYNIPAALLVWYFIRREIRSW